MRDNIDVSGKVGFSRKGKPNFVYDNSGRKYSAHNYLDRLKDGQPVMFNLSGTDSGNVRLDSNRLPINGERINGWVTYFEDCLWGIVEVRGGDNTGSFDKQLNRMNFYFNAESLGFIPNCSIIGERFHGEIGLWGDGLSAEFVNMGHWIRDYEGEVVRIKERGRHRDLVVRVDNDENLNGKKFDLKGYDLFDKDISVDPGSKVEFNLDGVRAVNGTITS